MRRILTLTLFSFAIVALVAALGVAAQQNQVSTASRDMVYVPVFVDVSVEVPGYSSIDGEEGEGWFKPPITTTTLPGLTQARFRVYQDGVPQQIGYLSQPMSQGVAGIVVSLSGRGPVKAATPQDSAFLSVSNAVRLLQQWGPDSFVDSAPWDSEGIYDAVTRSLGRLQQQADPRKAMVLISDGAIPASSKSADVTAGKRLVEAAKNVNFPIYFLFLGKAGKYGPLCCGGGSAYAVGRVFKEVAEVTGGEVFAADPTAKSVAALNTVSAQLLDKLRRRYVVGFTPGTTREGKWRKLQVKVDPPAGTSKIYVDSRTKYFDGPQLTRTLFSPATAGLPFPENAPSPVRAVRGIGDASKLLSRDASKTIPPAEAAALFEREWTRGNWRTIQYETEAYTAFATFGDAVIIRTTVAIEKPGRMRVELQVREGKGAGRALVTVSDGESTWISNQTSKQHARLRESPPPALLSDLDEMILRQLPDALNIGQNIAGRVNDLFKNLSEIRDPVLISGWKEPTLLRSETIEVGTEQRDCWVFTGTVSLAPPYSTRIAWIDKTLGIPLRIGMLREALSPSMAVELPIFAAPHFYEIRVISLRIDEPIPTTTFTFEPPVGSTEVPALPRATAATRY